MTHVRNNRPDILNGKTVVRGGMVCDGSGAGPIRRDLLIDGSRISAVGVPGAFDRTDAAVLDISGSTVAPGFIDAHSHGDIRKLEYPDNRSKLLQGITTEVDGNCGISPSCVPGEAAGETWRDITGYLSVLARRTAATNTVVLCGHNSIRHAVMGDRPDRAGDTELREMRRLLEAAFSAGAAGWSSGLTYFPGKFADTDELCFLAEATAGSDKIYATHLRSEGDRLIEAADEALKIARAGSGRLQISHLKTIFPRNYRKIERLLETLERARAEGVFLHADRYPYFYSSTRIGQTLPEPYSMDTDIAEKLRSSASFRDEITEALRRSPRDLATTIISARGKDLARIAAEAGCSVERACMKLLMEDPEQNAAYLCMSEENMRRILARPWVCAGTDGLAMTLDDPEDIGHPRGVGAFPRFFRLVSEMCGIGEAVRRMTSLPAGIFRIPERGLICAGYVADLVIFDAEKLDSPAGFRGENPMPVGVDRVIVAGKTAWCADRPETVGRFGRHLSVN